MGVLKKVLLPVIAGAAVYYAIFGGEHSMLELRSTRVEIREEQRALDLLRAVVDSLAARADSLRNDPLTLERLVRERHGMIREGEILYRFADDPQEEEPDSLEREGAPPP